MAGRVTVDAGPMLEYYELRKQWARVWMTPEESSGRGRGFWDFDGERWRNYIGITYKQYQAIEKASNRRRDGQRPRISAVTADAVLTGLGRPDLYQTHYGHLEVREPA